MMECNLSFRKAIENEVLFNRLFRDLDLLGRYIPEGMLYDMENESEDCVLWDCYFSVRDSKLVQVGNSKPSGGGVTLEITYNEDGIVEGRNMITILYVGGAKPTEAEAAETLEQYYNHLKDNRLKRIFVSMTEGSIVGAILSAIFG